jgi:hypothetical protein
MTDLRNRIANVAAEHRNIDYDGFNCNCGYKSGIDFPRWADHLADAVITQLGLEQESFAGGYCTRHVTQWELNDTPNNYCLRCGIPHTTPCKRGNK